MWMLTVSIGEELALVGSFDCYSDIQTVIVFHNAVLLEISVVVNVDGMDVEIFVNEPLDVDTNISFLVLFLVFVKMNLLCQKYGRHIVVDVE